MTSGERLEYTATYKMLLEYARKHPRGLRTITHLVQLDYDDSTESVEEMARGLPVIALRPQ